jgi:NADPH-dependent 2,4-dienoyl-CoA reductase/sulfur reductase-like enzyme
MPESRRCEVLVIGAGPAGLSAGKAAASCGRHTVILDDGALPGGQIWRAKGGAMSPKAADRFEAAREAGATLHPETTLVDLPRPGVGLAVGPDGPIETGFDRLVLATGARELFLPFPGWTLPNVTGVGGLQALFKGGLDIWQKKVVVAGSGPLLFAVAATLAQEGARVVAVAEQAPIRAVRRFALGMVRWPMKAVEGLGMALRMGRVRYLAGTWVVRAEGEGRVQRAVLFDGDRELALDCDFLAMGFGLVPNTEAARLLGCRMIGGFVAVDELQRTSVESVYCAGEPTGIGGVEKAEIEGAIAGYAACGELRRAKRLAGRLRSSRRFERALSAAFALRPEIKALAEGDTVVCRCEDVAWSAICAFPSWTEAKMATRCGMGPCQGRICGAALRCMVGWEAPGVRPPLFPVSVADLAAHGADPHDV